MVPQKHIRSSYTNTEKGKRVESSTQDKLPKQPDLLVLETARAMRSATNQASGQSSLAAPRNQDSNPYAKSYSDKCWQCLKSSHHSDQCQTRPKSVNYVHDGGGSRGDDQKQLMSLTGRVCRRGRGESKLRCARGSLHAKAG